MQMLRILFVLAVILLWFSPTSTATDVRATQRKKTETYVGRASWYGKQHQGKRMTNGERFDRRSFTAASRSLPLGTRIRVFNLDNGKFVDVTVTDRGPARLDRVLDLSEAAARQLAFIGEGVARVFFFVLPQPDVSDSLRFTQVSVTAAPQRREGR
jgi:rare lipoprotein A